MKIIVNGMDTDIAEMDLAAALVHLGYGPDGQAVATAVNESFVPAASRASVQLAAGDRVEILAPKQGG